MRAGGWAWYYISATADLRAQAVEFAQAPRKGGGAARMLGAAVGAAQGDGGEWYYMDARGMQQGPFGLQQMQQWYAAGYFIPELQAKRGRRGAASLRDDQRGCGRRRDATAAEAGDCWWRGQGWGPRVCGGGDSDAVGGGVLSADRRHAERERESLAASVQQPGAGKEEGRGAGERHCIRHPIFGSAPWRAEQERWDVFQQHQAVVLQPVRPTAVARPQLVVMRAAG